MRNTRAIGAGILTLVALVLFATRQAPTPTYPEGCDPERAPYVVAGLSYGKGFHAGLVAQQADPEAIAMAARNIAATEATIERCGW